MQIIKETTLVKAILQPFLIIFCLLGCQNQEKEKSKAIVQSHAFNLEQEIVVLADCHLSEDSTKISLVGEKNNPKKVSVEVSGPSINDKVTIKIDSLNFAINEISGVDLSCKKDGFQLKYIETLGNTYYATYHIFKLDKTVNKIVWSKIYKVESTRSGTSMLGLQLKERSFLIDYEGKEEDNIKFMTLYSFTGFQEGKTPSIEGFYQEIKSYSESNNLQKLRLLGDKVVLSFLLENISITNENLSKYNDIAYYFEQGGAFQGATFLLEYIIKNFPDRIVAYINLGDAYWGLEEEEKAIKAYGKYVELMKDSGKEQRIPERVFDRVHE
ncbi:tetratricopeptide repeat protein [Xanthovirga aplysinae]|uniref:tetratricopeptide repeat protein n=1 Tax=Xanthovirga aplysinae TaxID=2529853 RepID=UPI0012BD1908|nr:hypothetical protein [Xanthovirga aplysinae]MTI29549.1 hypothetical protein [Xanthovirga aplysinae]